MDETQLLMAQLAQRYAEQGKPGRDPFSPEQAGVSLDDAQAAMGGGDTGGELSPESRQWAEQYAKELGVKAQDLMQPASGDIAQQLGVEGIMPDYAGMKTMMLNIAKGHALQAGQAGGAGAGQAAENPELRQMLAYVALQRNAKNLGGIGGQMIGNLSPLLAPRMLGPYLEQQQAAALQQKQLEMQLKIAEQASKAALRMQQTRESLAKTSLAEARALVVGKEKFELKGTPSTGGFVFNPATGEIVQRVEPAPKGANGSQKTPNPFTRIDPTTGDKYRVSYKTYDDMWDNPSEPAMKVLVQKAGSAGERKDLARLYSMAKAGLEKIPAMYKKGLTGPKIGRALALRKTGGIIGQPFGAIAAAGLLNDEDLKASTALKAELEISNTAQVAFWSGTQVPADEMERRKNSQGLMTDYDEDFLPHLQASAGYLDELRKEWEREKGVDLLTGEQFATPAQSGAKFIGKPATGGREASSGVLTGQSVEKARQQYGY